MQNHIFLIGCGYSARATAALALARGWRVTGTARSQEKAEALQAAGIAPVIYESGKPDGLRAALLDVSHVLSSVAPNADGDPVLDDVGDTLGASRPAWIGYLSTVGVYGDHAGAWIDETASRLAPEGRGLWRIRAEDRWMALASDRTRVQVFRLAGIYGPGRNPFQKLRAGTARAIIKPGQVFNRIHVADIARTVMAGIDVARPGVQASNAQAFSAWADNARSFNARSFNARSFNVCDNRPATPQDVIDYAADLAGLPRAPRFDYETADLTPMARSFYGDCKRISNRRIRSELGVRLAFPTYQAGLGALYAAGE
ncbi:MAG: SDR family NAD(P)-dependent oxidoreductase [Pseudomonadota bacterium]